MDSELFSGDNAALLARGGLTDPRFGVESGSDEVLRLMGKQHRAGDVLPTVTALDREGIPNQTCWLVGFPGEEEDDYQRSLELLKRVLGETHHSRAICFPFQYHTVMNCGSSWYARQLGPVERMPLRKDPFFAQDSFYFFSAEDRARTLRRVFRMLYTITEADRFPELGKGFLSVRSSAGTPGGLVRDTGGEPRSE